MRRDHYDHPRAAVIEALKIVQQQARLGSGRRHPRDRPGAWHLPAADVEGVATFYNLISRQPVGRHVIKICDSVSCFLTGYDERAGGDSAPKLGVELGQTTPDDRFTLLPICCLGACDKGPVLMIDQDTHFDVAPDKINELLEQYK